MTEIVTASGEVGKTGWEEAFWSEIYERYCRGINKESYEHAQEDVGRVAERFVAHYQRELEQLKNTDTRSWNTNLVISRTESYENEILKWRGVTGLANEGDWDSVKTTLIKDGRDRGSGSERRFGMHLLYLAASLPQGSVGE